MGCDESTQGSVGGGGQIHLPLPLCLYPPMTKGGFFTFLSLLHASPS